MSDKKPYTAPTLEKTHHVWRRSIQRALDIELEKVHWLAAPRTSLVERDLVCPACRRSFGRILAPMGMPVHPVCEGCILEGRG